MKRPPQRDDVGALIGQYKVVASPLRAFLRDLHIKYTGLREGVVADYIPELGKANPDWFGICVVTTGGDVITFGDSEQSFTIQSVSKPFVYGLALERHGREATMRRIGVEPTGDAFNSLVKLDERSNRPHNPMVNAGAIAASNLIQGGGPPERLAQILDMFHRYIGHEPQIDMAVFTSERATGHRNRAIAHLMRNFGMIGDDIEDTLDLYFKQCSILVTCRDLGIMAATLANNGVNPLTRERAVTPDYLRDILSVMYTCGLYDYAGEWAYHVGLPAKSGVSGGIIAVAPGQCGIAVFSPLLDARGNSVRGIKVCEALSSQFGLHMFESHGVGARFAAALSGRPPAVLPVARPAAAVTVPDDEAG